MHTHTRTAMCAGGYCYTRGQHVGGGGQGGARVGRLFSSVVRPSWLFVSFVRLLVCWFGFFNKPPFICFICVCFQFILAERQAL